MLRVPVSIWLCVAASGASALEMQRNDQRYAMDFPLPQGAAFVGGGIDRAFTVGNVAGKLRLIQDFRSECETLVDNRQASKRAEGYVTVVERSVQVGECAILLATEDKTQFSSSFYSWLEGCQCFAAIHFYYDRTRAGEYAEISPTILNTLRTSGIRPVRGAGDPAGEQLGSEDLWLACYQTRPADVLAAYEPDYCGRLLRYGPE